MKFLEDYRLKFNFENEDDYFNYFMDTLTPTNRTWDFFVNWEKVVNNVNQFKIELNILNSLCGSKNVDGDLDKILTEYPSVIKAFPTLISIRDNVVDVLSIDEENNFSFDNYDFRKVKTLTSDEIKHYKNFLYNSQIITFITNGTLTNIKDYVFGVEVGMDTNGRKNRGGTINQQIVHQIISPICKSMGYEVIDEANQNKIRTEWGIEIPTDKTSRRFDFVIFNRQTNKLFVIETNFYNGGGSKLKSTCGEYIHLQNFLRENKIGFIWITDGNGWLKTTLPLRETFENNDYLLNLKMTKEGFFRSIIELD